MKCFCTFAKSQLVKKSVSHHYLSLISPLYSCDLCCNSSIMPKYVDYCIWVGSLKSNLICKTEKETQMYRTDFWTLWEKARVGCFERTASKHVYYLGWNRSPAHLDAWDKCSGLVRWKDPVGGVGGVRGDRVGEYMLSSWLIHVNVWQKPLQYCKVISLQLIKINEKKKWVVWNLLFYSFAKFFCLF